MTDSRVHPLLPVTRAELEQLVGASIVRWAPVAGGLTNTMHRVVLASGAVLVVRHHAGGAEPFRDELAAIARVAGRLPVPEIVRTDPVRRAIVYRWIEGEPLDACRRREPALAFATLAAPLGRLLATLAGCRARPGEGWDAAALLAATQLQLREGRARARLGAPLADAAALVFARAADRLAWGAPCVSHGDLGGGNLLVRRADGERWTIAGVIDWESAAIASPLFDVGGLFRYLDGCGPGTVAAFERGYRDAGGALPDGWLATARLLDATSLVDMLDEPRELPGVFASCRAMLARLVVPRAA